MANVFTWKFAIVVPRRIHGYDFRHVIVTQYMSMICLSAQTSVNGNCFPMWCVSGAKGHVLGMRRGLTTATSTMKKQWNMNLSIFSESLPYLRQISPDRLFFAIAAILHSRTYRRRYGTQLSLAFPRIPVPK